MLIAKMKAKNDRAGAGCENLDMQREHRLANEETGVTP